ncbi:MAG: hypothetical protein LUB62_02360 [Prevotellaceae bacterium]|nr:hypothetical protein [Prevotellaceae bacterium]
MRKKHFLVSALALTLALSLTHAPLRAQEGQGDTETQSSATLDLYHSLGEAFRSIGGTHPQPGETAPFYRWESDTHPVVSVQDVDYSTSNNLSYDAEGHLRLHAAYEEFAYYIEAPDGYYISRLTFTASLDEGLTAVFAENEAYTFSSSVTEEQTLEVDQQKVRVQLVGNGHDLTLTSLEATLVKGNAPGTTYAEGIEGKVVSSVATEPTTILNITEGDWYLMYNNRGGSTPLYDTGTEIHRATTADAHPVSEGSKATAVAQYLVRFLLTDKTSQDQNVAQNDTCNKVYNLQFATANYWAGHTTAGKSVIATTPSEEEKGDYNVYIDAGDDPWVYLNFYDMGSKVDNNGAGKEVAIWQSGYHSAEAENEEWTLYRVELADEDLAEDNTLSLSWTMTTAGWATLILPFDADLPEGMEAFTCQSLSGSTLELTPAPSLAKNTPYIIRYAGETLPLEDIICPFEGTPDPFYYTQQREGYLTGTLKDIYVPRWDTTVSDYVLQQPEGSAAAFFLVASDEIPLTANHCYLSLPSASEAKQTISLPTQDGGCETSLTALPAAEQPRGAAYYDLTGRKVSTPRKGIYIRQGRKQVFK